jgi:hypothetical protein
MASKPRTNLLNLVQTFMAYLLYTLLATEGDCCLPSLKIGKKSLKMKNFENYKLIHDFMFPTDPLKSWINSGNVTNIYASNWDSLMPVVEKIEHTFETPTVLERIEINSHYVSYYHHFFKDGKEQGIEILAGCYSTSPEEMKFATKIEAVYYVCIEWIKWYNKYYVK